MLLNQIVRRFFLRHLKNIEDPEQKEKLLAELS